MLVKLLSILTIPISYFLTIALWGILSSFNFSINIQLYFCIGFVVSAFLSYFFISANNFFSVCNHELCHMFWSILSFKKPKHFKVDASGNGEYAYYGNKNVMIVLSPYFFPMYLFLMIALGELTQLTVPLMAIFGILGGWTFSIQIKHASPRQTDLKIYGKLVSYIYIILFQLLFLSLSFSYVQGGLLAVGSMFENVWHQMVSFYYLVIALF